MQDLIWNTEESNRCDFDRHCKQVPMPDKCLPFCMERILRNASLEEKLLILSLEPPLAHQIFDGYNSVSGIESFSELQEYLGEEKTEEVLERFRNITQFQLDYFNKSPQERETIVHAIRNLGLDNGLRMA